MEIISCEDAKKLGLKSFYTGKPCANGHLSERYVRGSACIACCTKNRWDSGDQKTMKKRHRAENSGKLTYKTCGSFRFKEEELKNE